MPSTGKLMIALLRLIRFNNLLIIALTQYIMRYCIIAPFLKINNFNLQLSDFHFFLLVFSTILIAASGYVINDYFDTGTDMLNRPDKVVIDKHISRRYAMLMHLVMSFAGVGIGVYLSFFINVPGLSVIFILAAGLLWFYSTNYKRQFLIGNILVSVMTAFVPILVILFEMPLLNETYGTIMVQNGANFNYIFFWVLGFGIFAFITSLLREIIKDSEDFEGDTAYGMNTLPIVAGTKITKTVLISLICICIFLLTWVLLEYILLNTDFVDYISAGYFLIFLFTPLTILLIKIITAKSKKDYYISSQLTKLIMVCGVLYSFIVRYIVNSF